MMSRTCHPRPRRSRSLSIRAAIAIQATVLRRAEAKAARRDVDDDLAPLLNPGPWWDWETDVEYGEDLCPECGGACTGLGSFLTAHRPSLSNSPRQDAKR